MDLYESILRLILLIDIQKSNWPKVTVLRNGLNELGKGNINKNYYNNYKKKNQITKTKIYRKLAETL